MTILYYIVDTFTSTIFKGNPAGVCMLDGALDAELMQNIAAENNLSETAFVQKLDNFYDLRWFTPKTEVELCGHATLASAFVVMNYYDRNADSVDFKTKSGKLPVKRVDNRYELDFPAKSLNNSDVTKNMSEAIGALVLEAFSSNNSRDLLLLLKNTRELQSVTPDFELLKTLASHAVTITAKDDIVDFTSRFFAPNVGVNEDHATGSSHTFLIPFWSKRLQKSEMTARQLSKRGGYLCCKSRGERVGIAGEASLYLQGEVFA